MKLHIGPGNTYIRGWVNIDVFSSVRADIYSSAMALPYERETFEIVYASHILEHFNRYLILAVLGHWRDLLKPGGILRLAVPDFDAICEFYAKTKSLDAVMGLLYGGQRNMFDNHHVAFNYDKLAKDLANVGFKEIRKWNWRETEHAGYDDYSQAFLPHLSKQDGMLMSLNVEAVK